MGFGCPECGRRSVSNWACVVHCRMPLSATFGFGADVTPNNTDPSHTFEFKAGETLTSLKIEADTLAKRVQVIKFMTWVTAFLLLVLLLLYLS